MYVLKQSNKGYEGNRPLFQYLPLFRNKVTWVSRVTDPCINPNFSFETGKQGLQTLVSICFSVLKQGTRVTDHCTCINIGMHNYVSSKTGL